MKSTQRMGELVQKLKMNEDFTELWGMVESWRDELVKYAIHGTNGDPAENRGAAREFDKMVTAINESPKKLEYAKMTKGK